MADREAVYAYTFSGRSYDTGNKLGFLKATVEYALRREDLGDASGNTCVPAFPDREVAVRPERLR